MSAPFWPVWTNLLYIFSKGEKECNGQRFRRLGLRSPALMSFYCMLGSPHVCVCSLSRFSNPSHSLQTSTQGLLRTLNATVMNSWLSFNVAVRLSPRFPPPNTEITSFNQLPLSRLGLVKTLLPRQSCSSAPSTQQIISSAIYLVFMRRLKVSETHPEVSSTPTHSGSRG